MPVILVQTQHLGAIGTAVFGGFSALAMILILVVDTSPEARIGMFILAAFLLLLWLVFHRLTVILTDRELRAGFPMFKSRVPLSEIVSVEATPRLSLLRTGGLGLRITLDGQLAYYPRLSRAVRIERKRGLPLIVGSDDPEALVEALRRAAPGLEAEART